VIILEKINFGLVFGLLMKGTKFYRAQAFAFWVEGRIFFIEESF